MYNLIESDTNIITYIENTFMKGSLIGSLYERLFNRDNRLYDNPSKTTD